MKTNVLLCYGTFEEPNEEYKKYLDWAMKDSVESGAEKIVVCGGHTNNLNFSISEAESVATYLHKINHGFAHIELEDQSLTTNQNLEFASSKISPDDQITVYCDLARMAKIIWMASAYLLHKDRKEIANAIFEFSKDRKIKPFQSWNLTVKPFDFPSRDKYLCIAQTFSSLLEVEAIYDTEMENRIVEQRKIDFGIH